MKMKKPIKRIITGTIGFGMAAVMFFTGSLQGVREVEAHPRAFDEIRSKFRASMDSEYQNTMNTLRRGETKSVLKILEIVPGKTDDAGNLDSVHYNSGDAYASGEADIPVGAEMGYFLSTNRSANTDATTVKNPTYATLGSALYRPFDAYGTQVSDAVFGKILSSYRKAGMVTPSGPDARGNYPIFAKANGAGVQFFSNQGGSGDYSNVLDSEDAVVTGYYVNVADNSGRYSIIAGYYIDANGNNAIKKITTDVSTISGNDVTPDGSTVSENSLCEYNAETGEYHKYWEDLTISQSDLDTGALGLPKLKDGTQLIFEDYITNTDGTKVYQGKLNFVVPQTDDERNNNYLYYGYAAGDDTIYYTSMTNFTWFYSGEFFREYVLGSKTEFSGKNISYSVKLGGDVTVDDIEKADLVYISGQGAQFTGKIGSKNRDISSDVLLAIYNKEIYDHKAVMMDYANWDGSADCNVSKLALLLWQDQSALRTGDEYKDYFDETTGYLKDNYQGLLDDHFDYLSSHILSGYNGNFVTGNLYVYNHHMSDFKTSRCFVDMYDNFGNGDFISEYKDEAVEAGFMEVLSYIRTNNMTTITGYMPSVPTPAIAVQYILINEGGIPTLVKNSLNVLEIQPLTTFLFNPTRIPEDYVPSASAGDLMRYMENREAFVKECLNNYYNENIERIRFESMSVQEFNGRNEDLIESYDIIYIGSNRIGLSGTSADNRKYVNQGKPITKSDGLLTREGNGKTTRKYNNGRFARTIPTNNNDFVTNAYLPEFQTDSVTGSGGSRQYTREKMAVMTGNVYYTLGSEIDFNRANDYHGAELSYWVGNDDNRPQKSRYPGVDLSKIKLQKLEDYLDANKLILVAPDLMGRDSNDNLYINPTSVVEENQISYYVGSTDSNATKLDKGRIDNSSNMFELFKYAMGYRYDYNYSGGNGSYKTAVDPTLPAYPVYAGKNFVNTGDFTSNTVKPEDIDKYIAQDRISLDLSYYPTEYEYQLGGDYNGVTLDANVINPSTIKYLNNQDGMRALEYEFSISSDMDQIYPEAEDEGYTVGLYIDLNNDGKFAAKAERISDATIVVKATGEEPARVDGEYKLAKNVQYRMVRDLDDNFSGFVKWKLMVTSRAQKNSHSAVYGNTVVENIKGKKTIKILQLTNVSRTESWGGGVASTLDLQAQMRSTTSKYGKYLNNAAGYDLKIRTMQIDEFERKFMADLETARRNLPAGSTFDLNTYSLDYFKNQFEIVEAVGNTEAIRGVDMIVCGFGDALWSFENDEPCQAVQAFIEDGKPVLMSHDFEMYELSWKHWNNREYKNVGGVRYRRTTTPGNSKQSIRFRHATGMDKFGVTQNIVVETDTTGRQTVKLVNKKTATGNEWLHDGNLMTRSADGATKFKYIESTDKAVAYEPGSLRNVISKYTHGFTELGLYQRVAQDNGGTGMNPINTNQQIQVQSSQYTVDKVNSGQITSYPYLIPDNFKVAETHAQYYQLDMSMDDDDDGENDVVVWYTLGDFADGTKNYYGKYGAGCDPANAYYIYNRGNVTYTGAGHRSLDANGVSEQEVQLFVNTLFAAFEMGNTAPEAGFYSRATIDSPKMNAVTVPYDGNVTNPSVNNHTTTVDSSILKDEDGVFRYPFQDPNVDLMDTTHPTGADIANSRAITNLGTDRVNKGTVVYFKLKDTNFVRGRKSMSVRFYLRAEDMADGEGFVLSDDTPGRRSVREAHNKTYEINRIDDTKPMVDITDKIQVYERANNGRFEQPLFVNMNDPNGPVYDDLSSNSYYAFYLPMSYLEGRSSYRIYMETQTRFFEVSAITNVEKEVTDVNIPLGYDSLTVTKTDLIELQ